MTVTGKIAHWFFLPRHRRRVMGILLLAACLGAAIVLALAPRIPWRSGFATRSLVYCRLPSAIGLQPGQSVLAAPGGNAADELGQITELRPDAGGMLVVITLRRGVTLKNGSVLLCRAEPAAHRTSVSISSPAAGHDLAGPVAIPGEILPGPPDGYLEPLPRWPAVAR